MPPNNQFNPQQVNQPLPVNNTYTTPNTLPPKTSKYFFLELAIVVALYTCVTTFITFAFGVINYLFPDDLALGFYSSSMRYSISVLVVMFPVMIVLYRSMFKLLQLHPEDRDNTPRRFFSYLTIFLAGVTVIVTLITLINTFLNGEVTPRFFSKIVVVFLVSFALFWYTLRDLKGIYFEKPYLAKIFTIIISAVVVASIVGGLFIVGSPAKQRKLRYDNERVNEMSSLQREIVTYYQRTGMLPSKVMDLHDSLTGYSSVDRFTDPESKKEYDYSIVSEKALTFEICANFNLDAEDNAGKGAYINSRYNYDYEYYGWVDDIGDHKKGTNCYERTIDPLRYPVNSMVK
jgi:hypothetical protein